MVPEKLKRGDRIAVFSPSSPATATCPKRYARAKKFIEEKGFELVEGNLTGKQDFYRSGSIAERAEEFNALVRDPSVKCIMSAIGGMNTNSILPYIDYEAIGQNPKIIIGYSDMTALLLAIYQKTALTTYYGPAVVASFGELSPFVDETFRYFADILCEDARLPHVLPTPSAWTDEFISWEEQHRPKTGNRNELITVREGSASGRLIGGNLNTMQGLWGTEYFPAIRSGDILLIEDSLKDIATIERTFSLLKLSGVFDRIGGLLLGKHEQFNDLGTGRRPHEVLLEVLGKFDFPLLAEFDCCHTHPMLTLPIGATIELNATEQRVTLLSEESGQRP